MRRVFQSGLMITPAMAAVVLLGATLCGSQPPAPPAAPGAGPLDIQPLDLRASSLRRVDQGSADLGPLSTPSRSLLRQELRQEDDFRSLYQVPESAASPFAGWYVRRAGGLWAVFPRSTYVATRRGEVASVPPGTQYLLRPPEGLMPTDPASLSSSQAIATDVSTSMSVAIDTRVADSMNERIQNSADTQETFPGFARTANAPEAPPPVSAAELKRTSLVLLTSPKDRDPIIARLIGASGR